MKKAKWIGKISTVALLLAVVGSMFFGSLTIPNIPVADGSSRVQAQTTPNIVGVDPSCPVAQCGRRELTINGNGFLADSQVILRVGAEEYVIPPDRTTFVTSTQLRVRVGLYKIATWSAQVKNVGNGMSNVFQFDVAGTITAALDGELLDDIGDLIDKDAEPYSYYNPSWNVSKDQYKAWISMIAWSEGGALSYGAHSQWSLGSDVFYHKDAGLQFRFSTGIGPFQLDRGGQDGWDRWPTIRKLGGLDRNEPVQTVLKEHFAQFDYVGATLEQFAQSCRWFGVNPNYGADLYCLWAEVTGTDWDDHKDTKRESPDPSALDWNSIRSQLADNADAPSFRYEYNVQGPFTMRWGISTDEAGNQIKTRTGIDVSVINGDRPTWLVTARSNRTEHPSYQYYYTYDASRDFEVWVWNNIAQGVNEFRYVFVRDYSSEESGKENVNAEPDHIDSANPNLAGITLQSAAITSPAEGPLDVSLVSCDSQNFPFIYLTVRVSKDGQPVGNLTKEDFCVTEDTRLQTDMFDVVPPEVGGGVRMADIIFLIDNSGSMSSEIAAVKNNCETFADALVSSEIDYRLGLVQFGQSANGGHPRLMGSGLTGNVSEFKSWVATMPASGGYEYGFEAIRLAIQSYNFRPGAQKVFILITDEDSDDRNKQTTIDLIQANDVTVHAAVNCGYGTSATDYCDTGSVRDISGGLLFPVTGDYTSILDTIQREVANTYIVRYRTDKPVFDGLKRTVVCTVNDGVSSASVGCTYTPGGAPQIQRTHETLALHGQSLVAGSSPTISVNVTDAAEPFVQNVILGVRVTGSGSEYAQLNMSPQGGDIYSVQVPGSYVETPGLDYYIWATDGQVTSSDPSTDPAQKPYQLAVLPNVAPRIQHIPPALWQTGTDVTLEINGTDNTYKIDSLTVYYHRQGERLWETSTVTYPPATPTSVNETITLPVAGWNTPVIEYYIEVTDDLGLSSRWPQGGADAPYVLRGHYEESVPIYTRPFQAVPIAEMTVTYSKSGEINGEPIYLVSKIQVITRGFTGICRPQIFNQNGQEIWSSYLEIKPGKPQVEKYDVHLLVGGSDMFGISLLGFDLVNTIMRGIIKAKELYVEAVDKLLPILPLEQAVRLIEMAKGIDQPIEAFKESSMFVSKSALSQFDPESEVQCGAPLIPKAVAEYFKTGEFMEDWINAAKGAGLKVVTTAKDISSWVGEELKKLDVKLRSLVAKVFSPGEFRVYDSQGRVTGLVNGEVNEEIPFSVYGEEEGAVIITNALNSYRYEVVGTEEGSYGLEITSVEEGQATSFGASDIPTAPGAVHQYTIDWDALVLGEEGVTVQVDSDGDGEFEKSFSSDGELTQEEFLKATSPPPTVPRVPSPGGGGCPATKYLTVDWDENITQEPLYSNDRLAADLLGPSPDGRYSLLLERGTLAPTVDGKRHYLITVRELEQIPELPDNTEAIVAFEITPSGAEFDRDIFLTLGLDQSQLPENALNVTMAYYDDVNGVWVPLEYEGVAELSLSAAINHFSIFGVLAELAPTPPPPPAHFVASGLSIKPSVERIWEPVTFVTRTGESVTITANVLNDGGQEDNYTVELKLNGEPVDTETVTLGAGQSQPVSFTVSGLDYGQYEVKVAGLSGEFTTSRTINWWLTIVIIAAIGLIIWGVVWGRRRRKVAQEG